MEKILELYNSYRDYILFSILLIIFTLVSGAIFWYFSNDLSSIKKALEEKPQVEEPKQEETKQFTVDIKGEVKKPGVYILDEGKRVIDVVKKAGGFTVYADTSANNLSMKIKDEMVIVIYSENEISDYLKTQEKEKQINEMCTTNIVKNDSCITDENKSKNSSTNKTESSNNKKEETNSEENTGDKLVSINTATKEELMTISGIGESKADAIIEYRKENSFKTIEDIKNVSGIGDALFEKIKDYIKA